jgi:hypothetical protein
VYVPNGSWSTHAVPPGPVTNVAENENGPVTENVASGNGACLLLDILVILIAPRGRGPVKVSVKVHVTVSSAPTEMLLSLPPIGPVVPGRGVGVGLPGPVNTQVALDSNQSGGTVSATL